MTTMECSGLPESLERKIAAVSRSSRHIVRIVTEDEASHIRSMDGWMDGWFNDRTGAQIVLGQRQGGRQVIFRIG